MTAAVIILTLWAVGSTALYAAEFARRHNTEEKYELEVMRAATVQQVTREHDAWLRSMVERGADYGTKFTDDQRAIIDRLLAAPEFAPEEGRGLDDDGRLDVAPEDTADWTDFDATLWQAAEPGAMLGTRPAGFPAPDIEEL